MFDLNTIPKFETPDETANYLSNLYETNEEYKKYRDGLINRCEKVKIILDQLLGLNIKKISEIIFVKDNKYEEERYSCCLNFTDDDIHSLNIRGLSFKD